MSSSNNNKNSIQTGLLHGISYFRQDAESAAPNQRLRSDAVAVAMAMVEQSIKNKNKNNQQENCDSFCIIDPNVAFLMVGMNSCRLGPIDAMKKAKIIFVPIANFDTDIPEGGQHWTLLILQKDESFGASNTSETNSTSPCTYWFPPIHFDSLVASHFSKIVSHNQKFAERAAKVIIKGLAEVDGNNLKAELNPKINYSSISSSPELFSPIVVPNAPQQKNSYDCGIFIALATKSVLTSFLDDNQNQNGGNTFGKSIFFQESTNGEGKEVRKLQFAENWGYDQTEATRFKEDLFMAMSMALSK